MESDFHLFRCLLYYFVFNRKCFGLTLFYRINQCLDEIMYNESDVIYIIGIWMTDFNASDFRNRFRLSLHSPAVEYLYNFIIS